MKKSPGHAFISYVREDAYDVDRLQRTLEAAGVSVWRDTADLWPGEDWRIKIRRAITNNALVFIACFSGHSFARSKSYQNEELSLAIEQLRLRRPDDPWLIPVRFDDCELPELELSGGRTLASIQHVDLFGDKRDVGISRLVAAVLRILEQQFDLKITAQTVRPQVPSNTTYEPGYDRAEASSKPGWISNERPATSLTLSGRNSKVLEVDLHAGRYRLQWERSGHQLFYVRDESERDGKGETLIQSLSSYPNSGETVVRLTGGGTHILNVQANNIDWSFSFTPI